MPILLNKTINKSPSTSDREDMPPSPSLVIKSVRGLQLVAILCGTSPIRISTKSCTLIVPLLFCSFHLVKMRLTSNLNKEIAETKQRQRK